MKLGQKVTITKKYVAYKWQSFRREWRIEPIDITDGVFIGYRTLREGFFDWESSEPTKFIKVALVAINLRGCVYVPIDNLNNLAAINF